MDISTRHPSTQAAIRRLEPNPGLPAGARQISERFFDLGIGLLDVLPDDPDLVDALRKIWEAKNCAVYLSAIGAPMPVQGGPW